MRKAVRETIEKIKAHGIEVLSHERGRGSHVRLCCSYKGCEFLYIASECGRNEQRAEKNFLADLRRIRTAIDTNNPVLLERYLGRHR